MKVYEQERRAPTSGGITVTDITDEVNVAVRRSGIRSGIACVYSPHSTCCVRVNEFEAGLLDDFAALLRRLVPTDPDIERDQPQRISDQPQCVAMLLGPAGESIPVSGGALLLGRWQRVLFVELDREHDGRWLVEVVGSRR